MKVINRYSIGGFVIGILVGILLIIGTAIILAKVVMHRMESEEGGGLPAPEFTANQLVPFDWQVKTLEGEVVSMADFEGRVLFINFWATWCMPCRKEMPSIQKLYDDFKDRVVFLCISREESGAIEKFRTEKGYTFPFYKLEGDPPDILQSRGIPATYIVDRDSRLAFQHIGAADWNAESVRRFLTESIEP